MLGGRSEELAAEDACAESPFGRDEGRDDLEEAGKSSGRTSTDKGRSRSSELGKNHKNRGRSATGRGTSEGRVRARRGRVRARDVLDVLDVRRRVLGLPRLVGPRDGGLGLRRLRVFASDLILQLTTKAPPPPPRARSPRRAGSRASSPARPSTFRTRRRLWTAGRWPGATSSTATISIPPSGPRGRFLVVLRGRRTPTARPASRPRTPRSRRNPRECRVRGGALAIRTRKKPGEYFCAPQQRRRTDPTRESPFASCWVDSRDAFSQTYGRIEIRAKFPEHQCPGVSPRTVC